MATRLGVFPDAWDPELLLQWCGFECLAGCESVLAYGDAPDGMPGDAALRLAFTDARR